MPCDYKKYPKNWKEIREKVLSRTLDWLSGESRCELCYAPNHETVYRETSGRWYHTVSPGEENKHEYIKIILTVHHIDGNIKNNHMTNLIGLCQRCHNKLDMTYRIKHRKKSRK